MHIAKMGIGVGVAFCSVWAAAPARADVHVNIDILDKYVYPTLGLVVVDQPVLQPSVTFDLPQGASVQAWASTTIEDIDRPADNAASELDLIATCPTFGPLSCKVGYFWYVGGAEDGYVRVSVTGPLGFTASVERFTGVSDATSFGIATPAYVLGAATFQATANFTKTAVDEFEVFAGSATLPIIKNWDLKGQVFRTFGYEPVPGKKLDEVRLMAGVGFHFK